MLLRTPYITLSTGGRLHPRAHLATRLACDAGAGWVESRGLSILPGRQQAPQPTTRPRTLVGLKETNSFSKTEASGAELKGGH